MRSKCQVALMMVFLLRSQGCRGVNTHVILTVDNLPVQWRWLQIVVTAKPQQVGRLLEDTAECHGKGGYCQSSVTTLPSLMHASYAP